MAKVLWLMSTSVVLLAWILTSFVYKEDVPRVSYGSTIYFRHDNLHVPSSKEEIIELVQFANANERKIRVVGSGHSWSEIAATGDILVSLCNYTGIVTVDKVTKEVTVKGGTPLHQLNKVLEELGLAMTNIGSISEQTIAGAISTGTHGTGVKFGNIATQVTRMELITGQGEVMTVSKDDSSHLLKAAAVSIGMLGIITEVTIQCEDSFNLEETLRPMTAEYCEDNMLDLASSAQHVKLWLLKESGSCGVHLTNRTNEKPRDNNHFVLKAQVTLYEFIIWFFSWFESITRQAMGLVCTLSEAFPFRNRVDVSHKVFNLPFGMPAIHHESEVIVGIEDCANALKELWRVAVEFDIPVNHITEVRFVEADDIWLSPNYHRDSCHVTFCIGNARQVVRERYFNEVYKATKQFGARLHWGKYFNLTTEEVKAMYPKFSEFARVRAELDPNGVFLNDLLQKTFDF